MKNRSAVTSDIIRGVALGFIAVSLFLFTMVGNNGATTFMDMTVPFINADPLILHFAIILCLAVICLVLVCIRKKINIDAISICLFIKCILDGISLCIANQIFSTAHLSFYVITIASFFSYLLMINASFIKSSYTLIKRLFLAFGLVLSLQVFYSLLFSGAEYNSANFKTYIVIPYGGTNIIAAILVPLMYLSLVRVRQSRTHCCLAAVFFAAIIATRSRGGIILAGLCLLLIIFQSKLLRNNRRAKLIIIGIAGASMLTVLFFNSDLGMIKTMNFERLLDYISNGRLELWRNALTCLNLRNVWFGTGMYPPLHEITSAGLHNIALDVIVRCGVFGSINYAVLMFFVFKKGLNQYRKDHNPFFVMVTIILINSLFEICYFSYKCDTLLWMFVGLSVLSVDAGNQCITTERVRDSSKKKVLLVNCVYNTGSTGKIVAAIHGELQKHGYESVVCYGRGAKCEEPNVYKTCGELYSKINNILTRFTGVMYGGLFFSTRKLISVIEAEKPDIVHLHCINGYFVNVYKIISYLKKQNIKTVITHHAEFLYTANCGHALECEKWKTGCGKCPRRKQETRSVFFDGTHISWKRLKDAYEGFDNLVVTSVSPWLNERAKESPMLKDKKHEVILNGLETDVFHLYDSSALKEKHGLTNEKILFHATPAFSNDPDHIKGGYYILKLAEKLRDQNVIIIVAGSCEGVSSVPDNVILLGAVENQNLLARYYSLADITLLASKKETFSMVVAESLCCGTPIVGFMAGAPEQIALHEYSAFVKHGDVNAMYEKVLEYMQKPFDKKQISDKAIKKYSKTVMAEAYISVYEGFDGSL